MILITNDDGYESMNLHRLYDIAKTIDDEVKMVVSLENQSGVGNCSSSTKRIYSQKIDEGYIINGTPVDCIRYGLSKFHPSLILTGINNGYNIGVNCLLCSGTFMSAREGANKGVKSMAISVGVENNSSSYLIGEVVKEALDYDFMLANLNIVGEKLDITKVCDSDYETVIKGENLYLNKFKTFPNNTDAESVYSSHNSSLSIIRRDDR